ncbi:MAG: efflux RND transporter periplasmic adaptor subunit [Balneolales bacterium]|nr:efflux RND transporter periplasmic adaptor subunit [Balneolales bacterium]
MKNNKSRKSIFWIAAVVLISAGGLFFYIKSGVSGTGSAENGPALVQVERSTIVDLALAVGHIQPEQEIQVKSKISGVVNTIFAQAGDYVRKGDPLMEVRPDPTPLEITEARRNLERTQLERASLQNEFDRIRELQNRNLVSAQDFENLSQRYEDVRIREQMNLERLELLESGRVMIGDQLIESVIRAPVDGYILEVFLDPGEPVVPLSSYQAGTPLMTIANMDNLLFKGTVDEIDVGKLSEGMPVMLKIGALPGVQVEGVLSRISLKATNQDNSTVFPVEIEITNTGGAVLRAGYSANAEIIIHKRPEVLTLPERVIVFNDGRAMVEIPGSLQGERKEVELEVGLSDAITIEVVSGLQEGDKVYERPVRRLAVR